MGYLPGLGLRGLDICLFSGTPKAKKLTANDLAQDWYQAAPGSCLPTEVIHGVPVHRVRLCNKSSWRRAVLFNQALLKFCRDPASRPDVIQLIEPLSPIAVPWLRKVKQLGIARVFAYTLPYEMPADPFKRIWRLLALRLLYRELDHVVTGSTITRDLARGLGLKNRTEVIPNGVDLQRFRPVPYLVKKDLRLALGLGEIDRMMITVGSIIPRKGIDLLLESWQSLASRFPDLHFVLVGPRTDVNDPKLTSFNQKLEKLVNSSGAGNRVHFTGRVQNVEAYLQAADLFVFASEREGMANVILEAMASGLPVVMTPHIGLPPDFGKPAQQYLLAERNSMSVVKVVSELLEDAERCRDLSVSGRRWVEQSMDLNRVLDRYAALYHELAGRH